MTNFNPSRETFENYQELIINAHFINNSDEAAKIMFFLTIVPVSGNEFNYILFI